MDMVGGGRGGDSGSIIVARRMRPRHMMIGLGHDFAQLT